MFSTVFCNNFKQLHDEYPELIKNGYFVSSLNTTYLSVYNELLKLNENDSYTVVKNVIWS